MSSTSIFKGAIGPALAAFLICYAGVFAFSAAVLPPQSVGYIDTGSSPTGIYMDQATYLSISFGMLRHAGQRVLIIGASNASHGLRPPQLKALLGGVEVDNLALAGNYITDVEEIVDLAYENIPKDSWDRTTFVLGLTYPMFLPSSRHLPDGVTRLDRYRLQFGLYRRDDRGAVRARLPADWMSAWAFVVRPFLTPLWLRHEFYFPDRDFDSFVLSATQKQEILASESALALDCSAAFPAEALRELIRMARNISEHGSRLVILDLPEPVWFQEAIPAYGTFEAAKRPWIEEAVRIPGVSFGSIREGFTDGDFYDQFHPRPRSTVRWAQNAALVIRAGMGER